MRQEDITYTEKINELRLDLSHPNSQGINFIFLEGDTDIRLFRKFFNLSTCKVEKIPGGNSKVEECVQTLSGIYPLIIGIRDSDFIRLNNPTYNKQNIFLTDYHDIEVLMLENDIVLNSLVFEFSNIDIAQHHQIKENLINILYDISLLKLLNDRDNLELSFTVGFQDLINTSDFTLDFNQFIMRVISKSPNYDINDIPSLLSKIDLLKNENPNLLQITNGHDLIKCFATLFRNSYSRSGISDETLSSSIRMTYCLDSFKQTNLFSELLQWESNNQVQLF